MHTYTIKKILNLYNPNLARGTLISAEKSSTIPEAKRKKSGSVNVRYWNIEDLPQIGERYGYIQKLEHPTVVTVFTTKGGVLKTTLALNLARIAALHNIRTCAIGLDLQGDISTSLGYDFDVDDTSALEEAIQKLNQAKGLADLYSKRRFSYTPNMSSEDSITRESLDELILDTDIPTLKFIPETPELAVLEQDISTEVKREYWLKGNVIDLLKEKFDLIIIDCGPNWNILVTNALVACDALICPLECKINNFRNFKVFKAITESFREKLGLTFEQIFVPSRLVTTRKLAVAIHAYYLQNVKGCTTAAIRESIHGEESVAAKMSVPEYAPRSPAADEIRTLLIEIWERLGQLEKRQSNSPCH